MPHSWKGSILEPVGTVSILIRAYKGDPHWWPRRHIQCWNAQNLVRVHMPSHYSPIRRGPSEHQRVGRDGIYVPWVCPGIQRLIGTQGIAGNGVKRADNCHWENWVKEYSATPLFRLEHTIHNEHQHLQREEWCRGDPDQCINLWRKRLGSQLPEGANQISAIWIELILDLCNNPKI